MSPENPLQAELICSPPDGPARATRLLASAREWMTSEADFSRKSLDLLECFHRTGLYSKTSPTFSASTTVETLRSSSEPSSNAGMACAGGFLTLNTSVWHKDASVCSLWEILEERVASKYYLTPKACAGILRRAAKRGKELSPHLEAALRAQATRRDGAEKMTATSSPCEPLKPAATDGG